ncbi:MAG: Holliday junction resolvase RuvX [bacterium]|nr:Holliday junction resolvase RuvX [bacterium]
MKILGVDWGLKRVGLAVSEGSLASPFKVLKIKGLEDGVKRVVRVVKEEGVDYLVMGQPEGEMGRAVEKAAQALIGKGLKVELTDETLSTQEAKRVMLEMRIGKKARQEDNALSAAIILQRFLDEKI